MHRERKREIVVLLFVIIAGIDGFLHCGPYGFTLLVRIHFALHGL